MTYFYRPIQKLASQGFTQKNKQWDFPIRSKNVVENKIIGKHTFMIGYSRFVLQILPPC